MTCFRTVASAELQSDAVLLGTRGLRTSSFLWGKGKENALFESVADAETIVNPHEAVKSAGLRYPRMSPSLPCCRPFTKPYDRAELIVDGILHVAGIGFALTGLTLLISMADELPAFQSASVWIYGIGLVSVVATSAAYNAWPLGSTKLLLRRFDQSAIYLFIAASYTPIIARTDIVPNKVLLTVIWTLAWLGVVLKLAFPFRFERMAILLCLALGWSGLFAYDLVFSPLAPATVGLIMAAGTLYSVGVVFHLWDNLRFQNAIWHAFVLSAAGLQFLAVFDVFRAAAAATG